MEETVRDATTCYSNKTLTGEIATEEKIAAYELDLPHLGIGGKIIAVIELIGLMYIMYNTFSFMTKHITHVMHLLAH